MRLDNTVTGGSSQNSTKKYIGGGKGTGLSKTSVLDMLKKTDSFTSATEAWVKEAGVKIEANHADLYATKKAITGNWAGDVETINALITASSDNGGLVSMLVGRHNKLEDVNAAISATAAGGGLINMKADAKTVTDIGERLSSAEITLNGADGQIGLVGRVETAEGDIKSAAVKIDGLNSTISLKADATVTDALGERVSSAEVKIDGLNSEIELKADKITLNGYVTMSKFNAEIAEIKITDSSYVTTAALNTKSLSANYAEISSINIGGKQARWESVTVVTGVTRKKRYAMAPSGTTNMEFYECASVSTDTFTLLMA